MSPALGDGAAGGLHTLVLSSEFPPVDSSVARRAMAIANSLAQAGGAVTVLSVDSRASVNDHGIAPALQEGVDPRVRVVHVVDDHPDLVQDIALWPRDRAVDPAGWRAAWLQQAADTFDEPGAGHLLRPVTSMAASIHGESPVDLVVAVAVPVVLAVAGAELSEAWGCGLVVDLARATARDLAVESERVDAALGRARVVCVPDEATRSRLDDRFHERIALVPEGGEVAPQPAMAVRTPSGPVAQIGCFVEADAWDSFVDVLEGWFEARDRVPEFADATFTVHGRFPLVGAGAVRMAAAQAADRGVVLDVAEEPGAVHPDRDADLLVVVSRGDLPAGRTLDHLGAGRPIAWCTAREPAADHPYERAAHVVRARTLASGDICSAMLAAAGLEAGSLDADPLESSWPAAVPALVAAATGRSVG